MLYEYECQTCFQKIEARRTIAEMNDCPQCPKCGGDSEKRIFTPSMNEWPEWDVNYKCIATGEEITSMAQRKRVMKENGLVDCAEFNPPDFDKLAEQQEEFLREAHKEQEVPEELAEAMVREDIKLGYTDNPQEG